MGFHFLRIVNVVKSICPISPTLYSVQKKQNNKENTKRKLLIHKHWRLYKDSCSAKLGEHFALIKK